MDTQQHSTTGTDHRRSAENLLAQAHHFTYGDGADPTTGHALAAAAQGHALLAIHDRLIEIGDVLETSSITVDVRDGRL